MDSEKTSNAGARKKESRLLLAEEKDVQSVSDFADNQVKEIEELEKDFDEMGFLRLVWDSKIPEEKKWFFNRVSFKCSDKEIIKIEIKKYLDFYKAMCTAMGKINGDVEKSEKEAENPCSIIYDLNGLLIDMDKQAQSGAAAADSTAVFKLHTQFIEKHTRLQNMVKRVECVVSRDRIKTLTSLLDNCQKTILTFQNGLQDFQRLKEGMEEQIAELVKENEKQRQHQQSLIAVNAKLREDQQNLLSQYDNSNNRLGNIEKLLNKLLDKE